MKRIAILLCITILLPVLSPALRAGGPGDTGLDVLAGCSVSFADGAAIRGDLAAVSLCYHRGIGFAGFSADFPVGVADGTASTGELGLNARAGFRAAGARLSVSPFVTARCGWLDGPGPVRVGWGATAGFRAIGPFGVFVEAQWFHDVHTDGDSLRIAREGVRFLSAGIQLSI